MSLLTILGLVLIGLLAGIVVGMNIAEIVFGRHLRDALNDLGVDDDNG